MRRLARWLFTLCSALSLLLCVAVCVLWVRSYSAVFYVRHAGVHADTTCGVSGGHLVCSTVRLVGKDAVAVGPRGLRAGVNRPTIDYLQVHRREGAKVVAG